MNSLTVHDVLSPTAIALAKTIGYGVIWVAWGLILLSGMRAYYDGRAAYARFKQGK